MDEWDNNPALQLFKCVLSEAIHGCELAKELQMKMDSTQGPHLRHLVMQSSAEIISTFQNVLELLKSNPNPNSLNWGEDSGFAVEELITEEIGARGQSQMIPIKSQRHEYSASGAHSHASGNPPASDMSQGSTVPNLGISSKPKCKYAAYGSENEAASLKERVQTSKKKKPLLRWTTRIRANNSEVGNDGPPYDGHTWRKYGQKDILGALYPRSYYRCTHKNDLGCQAIKQVQRADDDSSFFEVTYRGLHSCQIDPPLLQIQMPFQDPQIGSSSHLNSSFWQDCNTSTGHGLSPTHSKPTSRQATMPLLGISSGSPITETENISDFVPYYPHLLHIPPNEGNSSSNAMQPNWPENSMQPNTSNRPAMISVSLFRKQSSEAENLMGLYSPKREEHVASSEEEHGMGDYVQIFGSSATCESNYVPVPPTMPLMTSMERLNTGGHHLQTSESDLTVVVSRHTSADDSSLLDMDVMFNTDFPGLQL